MWSNVEDFANDDVIDVTEPFYRVDFIAGHSEAMGEFVNVDVDIDVTAEP